MPSKYAKDSIYIGGWLKELPLDFIERLFDSGALCLHQKSDENGVYRLNESHTFSYEEVMLLLGLDKVVIDTEG